MTNKEILKSKYESLIDLLGIESDNGYENINVYIRKILRGFMQSHSRVAVYCYGVHTQMLMADFVGELRNIICIIDNGKQSKDGNFLIIKDSEIENYELDGIIISSFRYKEEIKENLRQNYKSLDVLDIYDDLKKYKIYLEEEFYLEGPYQVYKRINTLIRELNDTRSLNLLRQLLQELVTIKEFRLAGNVAKEIHSITLENSDNHIWEIISNIYQSEIKTAKEAGNENTLMLCIDGMRREDFLTRFTKTYSLLRDTSFVYGNAYSYSTMTYESLVPVFSENTDQRTKYYLNEEINAANCRFMDKAIKDRRFIAVYGDGNHYIYDDSIKYVGKSQTLTEKIWDFLLDIDGCDDGLFYLHELYESHYSFANPYTEEKLISLGSAMLFDYLPQINGSLKTDYVKQQGDALKYLDDTLAPFIEALSCKLVIFADHGNIILEPGTKLVDIKPLQLTVSEEWIRIPLVIRSENCGVGRDDRLISLLELNDIMLSVLDGKRYEYRVKDYIKIGRSAIYNQQFKEIYRRLSVGYNGEALEGFIFKEGYKLLIFENGIKELYFTSNDERIEDVSLIESLYDRIKNEVTIL